MSLPLRLAGVVLVALTLAGCGGDDTTAGQPSSPAPSSTATTQPTPEPTPEPEPTREPDEGTPEPSDATTACEEVVAGIEAFNRGELEETVAAFERALPLAEAEDDANGTELSSALLEAVQYYAELAPEDYPQASTSSPEFAR